MLDIEGDRDKTLKKGKEEEKNEKRSNSNNKYLINIFLLLLISIGKFLFCYIVRET